MNSRIIVNDETAMGDLFENPNGRYYQLRHNKMTNDSFVSTVDGAFKRLFKDKYIAYYYIVRAAYGSKLLQNCEVWIYWILS